MVSTHLFFSKTRAMKNNSRQYCINTDTKSFIIMHALFATKMIITIKTTQYYQKVHLLSLMANYHFILPDLETVISTAPIV